jgi:hypothetical protein
MLPNIDYSELPRALQHMLERDQTVTSLLPRRSFLKLAGAGGLALGAFPHIAMGQAAGGGKAASALKPTQQPSAFVQIAGNGEVTVTINRLEFGQGVHTALPMILAEELDADWSLVRSRHGTNDAAYVDPLFGIHLTGGSHSIKNSFTQYRELGARARAMLLGAAAAMGDANPFTTRLAACAAMWGLDALVEVHSADELSIALDAGATVVGVNNRNLRTLTVDVTASEALIARIPKDVVAVSESGLRTSEDLLRLRQMGYGAFLIGERFMTAADPGAALRDLMAGVPCS